jgi:protein involved in polysaccharide export with SLBB domain
MIRFKLIACGIIFALFLHSCGKILEPVSLFSDKQDITLQTEQEEFEINITSLTFETVKKANSTPYPRQVILTGSGSRANVLDETNFLTSSFPKSSSSTNYFLGIGDQISFAQLNEFETKIPQWPSASKETEYLLGPGDQLAFAQSNDSNQNITISYGTDGQLVPQQENSTFLSTKGTIGTNGNVLLFGLGNISAANRTLESIRTEVRNILIRKGLAPNFQLDINNFKSKKAFVTISDQKSELIFLNDLPITLKQIALRANLSKTIKGFAVVKLTRNAKEFRLTAEQLFDLSAPEIIIQDNDQIEIEIINNRSIESKTIVGSKGYILLPNVGSIYALNRTIDDLHKEISSILISKGIKPSFQLELTEFASKKVYLVHKGFNTQVVPLMNSNTNLRQLLLKNINAYIRDEDNTTEKLTLITLKRNSQEFRMTWDQILDPTTQDIWVSDEDHIEIEHLTYKPGRVFALGGSGRAEMVFIDPSRRETLADILFTPKGALNNLMARLSEVYLLRGQNPSVAYHLDAQNVSRILVAAKTQLRPNDIVYVADRPIISFSRTLAELNPLRILLRDLQDGNIP